MLKKISLLLLYVSFTCIAFAQEVQSPSQFLGYKLGSQFTSHFRIVEYFNYVAKTSKNVKLLQYGATNEGRPLMAMFIASDENIGRLEEIRQHNLSLTGLSSSNTTLTNAPVIVWLSYNVHGNEPSSSEAAMQALYEMVSKMGIVTLFCNIAAAIGFGVFALTKSAILKEFGVVAGINIMMLFVISVILIPAALSYLPDPRERHMKYLTNRWLTRLLDLLEHWALHHKKTIYITTLIIVAVSLAGMMRLRSETYILDDLPKTDPVYTDLKFFETNFKGVMPLEILVDTKRKNGIRAGLLSNLKKIDSLAAYINTSPFMARPLSVVEGLKFVRQAYYDNDSSNYGLPNEFDISFLSPYLNMKADSGQKQNNVSRLAASFIDSNRQILRVSVNMADIGSIRLPKALNDVQQRADELFDTAHFHIEFTGTTVTFLEGSAFIISGLKQSIFWAFLLIAACMLYLFKSIRILICSLLPNVIPLVITAGVMGWTGVPLKPSTVLVFSIALGIAIDITIRFLVNFKQDSRDGLSARDTVIKTIHSTGISIVYTSLVLIAGFVIFCFSGFGGTQALGWLTSLTLVMATLTNLIFLPSLLISVSRGKKKVD